MNPEQKRIAIAEACGWTRKKGMRAWNRPDGNGWDYVAQLPDYLNDLNAMHEAEKVMTKEQMPTFEYYLTEITGSTGMGLRRYFIGEVFKVAHATATQRADAFIATLGLDKQTNTNQ
jgi:hypothetical protein